ncbi:MAG: RnfH family protein [Proteobacteria bacterium]|nr:RnfH family protein [Pseudomonadota bacterium]
MAQNETIQIELVYINPESQHVVKLEVPTGSSIEDAIRKSDVLSLYPEIDLNVNKIGVYSKIQNPDYILEDGDRVEIYQPLQVDPKEARRRRAIEK